MHMVRLILQDNYIKYILGRHQIHFALNCVFSSFSFSIILECLLQKQYSSTYKNKLLTHKDLTASE